jgi:hypothetical protein
VKVEAVFENVRPGPRTSMHRLVTATKQVRKDSDLLVVEMVRRLPYVVSSYHCVSSNVMQDTYVAFQARCLNLSFRGRRKQLLLKGLHYSMLQVPQILAHTIPGAAGTLENGNQLVN